MITNRLIIQKSKVPRDYLGDLCIGMTQIMSQMVYENEYYLKIEHPFDIEYMNFTEGKNFASVNQYHSRFIDRGITYDEFIKLLESKNVYRLMQNDQLVAIVACRENGTREVIRISVWYSDVRGIEKAPDFIQKYVDNNLKHMLTTHMPPLRFCNAIDDDDEMPIRSKRRETMYF